MHITNYYLILITKRLITARRRLRDAHLLILSAQPPSPPLKSGRKADGVQHEAGREPEEKENLSAINLLPSKAT